MFKRIFFCFLYVSVFISTTLIAEENLLFYFGPESKTEILITTPYQKDDSCVQQIHELARYLEKNPPQIHITLALTANDFSILPFDLRPENPEGTANLIKNISGSKNTAVILLVPGTTKIPIIINGALKTTSPKWLVKSLCTYFDQVGYEYNLAQRRTPLFRLGWQEESSFLGDWLKADFPAIAIEGTLDLPQFISHIENQYPEGLPKDTDRHYLLFSLKNSNYFLGEEILVLIGIISSAAMLFSIFFLGFLFGTKSEQHLRDFLHVWWIPFLFLAVNILALFSGQGLTYFLFKLRFSTSNSWTLLPHIALMAKLIFSWFVFAVIVSFNQLIRLPEDDFIYGYMASLVCMISIFIFSSIDFSLSHYFLFVYLIVYLSSHTKKMFLQFLAMILMLLPAIPYLIAIINANYTILEPLMKGTNFWNVNFAFFIMPYQLMLTRIFHLSGRMGFKKKVQVPVNVLLTLVSSIVISSIILFIPAWSKENPVLISIRQIIDSSGSSIILDAPTIPEGITTKFDQMENTNTYTPEQLIPCSTEIHTFLERQLVTLHVSPAVPPARIDITIKTDEGFSIYDASIPFTLSNGGNIAHFRTRENPKIPFTINFSTDLKTRLVSEIQVLSLTNPLGLRVIHDGVKTTYVLDARRNFEFPPPPKSRLSELLP